ncbi:Protein MEMO1 [Leucoagaricus sp. SymC.cos]|nr:Protein MEMO1 [Leucoagaricus sp. SymC.cos]
MQQTQYTFEENRFRGASHAGSWYTSNAPQLTADLLGWLGSVGPRADLPGQVFPSPGCKAIIAPHAGYQYSGSNAAWAYKCIDPSTTRRVFILGPSHNWSIGECALTRCHTYDTPIGTLPVDTAADHARLLVVDDLHGKGGFLWMNMTVDEEEHSIEMQLPYLRKVCEGKDIKIVPILVGRLSAKAETQYGEKLAPYLNQEGTVFIASSDFCHWGQRFNYCFYYPKPDSRVDDAFYATRAMPPERDFPIYKSITKLDHEAMGILSDRDRSAILAHRDFHRYLKDTGNTICGRHAIGVLYGALAYLEQGTGRKASCRWIKYDHSEDITKVHQSSVSYASAWINI